MTSPALEQINAALATVNDPEIRRPITDLGMVASVEADDDGQGAVIAPADPVDLVSEPVAALP